MKYCIPDMSDWTTDEKVGIAKAVAKIRHCKAFPYEEVCKLPHRSQEEIYNLLVHIVQTNIKANQIEDDQ